MPLPKNSPDAAQNRKPIALFRSFSSTEMSDFCRFVQNSYFNTDEKLVKLAQFLHNMFRVKPPKHFDTKAACKAYANMYGKTNSVGILDHEERVKLNDKLSRLTKLGVEYLSILELRANSGERTKLLLNQFAKRKLPRFFETLRKKEKNKLEQQSKDRDFYLGEYELERSVFEYQFRYDLNKLFKSDNLAGVVEALDVYYLMDRMMLHLAGMALINVGAKSYDFQPMKWVLGLSELPQYKNIPVMQLCRTACYMESCKLQAAESAVKNEEAQQHFDEFSLLLSQYGNELSDELNIQFYTLAINFCSHQLVLQNSSFYQRGFELYRNMEKKGLLIQSGRIRASRLVQATALACRTANLEWAQMVLYKYGENIDTTIREGVSSLILGQIAFYQSDFQTANELFFITEQQAYHHAYSSIGRISRLKCIYELNHFSYEKALAKLKSEINFRTNSKVLSPKAKKSQINFVKALTDLYKIRDSIGRERKAKILERIKKVRTKIEGYQYVRNAPWLLEKLGELQR